MSIHSGVCAMPANVIAVIKPSPSTTLGFVKAHLTTQRGLWQAPSEGR